MAPASVFISYSRKDLVRARQLAAFLTGAGISVWYDRRLRAGDNFQAEISEELKAARRVIVIWTKKSVESRWVNSEAMYAADRGTQLLQLRWEPCEVRPPFNIEHGLHVQSLNAATKEQILRSIGAAPVPSSRRLTYELRDVDVEIGTIPPTSADVLFGREKDISRLLQLVRSGETNVAVVRALGGEGKTSLLNHFIQTLKVDSWGGARRVFGWSFYQRGTEVDHQAAAQRFFDEALSFFGYDGPALQLSEAKCRELLRLVRRERTVLILDGLEPLQNITGRSGVAGRLKDGGLIRLLRDLATASNCFCLITTRVEVSDLRDLGSPAVERIELQPIPDEAAVAFLRHLSVHGPDDELAAAVRECRGHALSLSLLGRYLRDVHAGDIYKRKLIADLEDLDTASESGERPVTSIMQHYELHYFARQREVENKRTPGKSTAARQLALLRLMGLVDRPVELNALLAVVTGKPIKKLTGQLVSASRGEIMFALQALGRLGLVTLTSSGPARIDAHPLVRRYFAETLRRPSLIDGAREGHSRLFEYYRRRLPTKPDKSSKLEDLALTMLHACAAGQLLEAYEIYDRINRGSELYLTKLLGAHGLNIEILSALLNARTSLRQQIEAKTRSELYGQIATSLQSLGRTEEAERAYARSYSLCRKHDLRSGVRLMAQFRADLAIDRAQMMRAEKFARIALEDLPNPKGPKSMRTWAHCIATLGNTLAHAGKLEEATKLFERVEASVKKIGLIGQVFRGRVGVKYFDYLTLRGDVEKVRRLTTIFLGPPRRDASLVSRGLELMCVGRQRLADGENAEALVALDAAVDVFWKGADYSAVIRGLLFRSRALNAVARFDEALDDVREALELAEQSKLYAYVADAKIALAEVYALRLVGIGSAKLKSKIPVLRQEAIDHLLVAEQIIRRGGNLLHWPRLQRAAAHVGLNMAPIESDSMVQRRASEVRQ